MINSSVGTHSKISITKMHRQKKRGKTSPAALFGICRWLFCSAPFPKSHSKFQCVAIKVILGHLIHVCSTWKNVSEINEFWYSYLDLRQLKSCTSIRHDKELGIHVNVWGSTVPSIQRPPWSRPHFTKGWQPSPPFRMQILMKKMRHVANTRLRQCKVHPTDCTFHSTERSCFLNVLCPSIAQCTLHPTIRCSIYFAFILNTKYIHHNVLLDANYIQLDVVCTEGVGALKDFSSKPLQTNWVLVANQPTAPPVARSIDGIDISLSVTNSLVCAILLCGSQLLRVRSSKIMTLKLT